jgi:hypothetical protein
VIRDDAGPQRELDGSVTALAPDADGTCWGVLDRRTLVRRDLDGSWDTVPAEVDGPITAVHPTGFGAFLGTADARLWAVVHGDAAPVTGFDAVAGRERWHAVGSPRPYVRSVSSTVGDGALLASVHVGGIPRSTNGGASWSPTVDIDADVHEVRAHPVDSNLVMAAAAVGLLESGDGGATWRAPTTRGLHATYLRALAFPTGAVIVSASDGPFGHRAALYRRELDGRDFERCTAGLPEWLPAIVDTGLLAARGQHVVAGIADQVARSDDGGQRWVILAGGLGPVTAMALLSTPGGARPVTPGIGIGSN